MMCKCENIKLYDGEHRCMECFEEYVPEAQLEKIRAENKFLKGEYTLEQYKSSLEKDE